MAFKFGLFGGKRGKKATVEGQELERAQRDLKNLAREQPKVASRALNKSLTGTKTDMKKVIREDYSFKARALEKRINVKKANKGRLNGHILSKGKPVHLTDLAGTKQTKKGVKVNVKKSTGRQLIPSAFIRKGKYSGKKIVLQRTDDPGKSRRTEPSYRYPVKAIYAPHPEILYNEDHNWTKIQDAAAKRIDKNMAREQDAELRKQIGKW